jgi:hypothetical protein
MERSELTCSRTGTWLLPEAGDSARPWTTARFSLAEPVPSHHQALEQRRRNAPRGAMIRKPSCFNSCSQPSPLGTRSARTGWQGGMKPGGTRRRQAGTGERTNIGRICAGRAGSGVPATIGPSCFQHRPAADEFQWPVRTGRPAGGLPLVPAVPRTHQHRPNLCRLLVAMPVSDGPDVALIVPS